MQEKDHSDLCFILYRLFWLLRISSTLELVRLDTHGYGLSEFTREATKKSAPIKGAEYERTQRAGKASPAPTSSLPIRAEYST